MIWCVCCFIAFISCLETEKPPLGAVLDGPRLSYDLQWNKPNVYNINGSNVGSWKQISFFFWKFDCTTRICLLARNLCVLPFRSHNMRRFDLPPSFKSPNSSDPSLPISPMAPTAHILRIFPLLARIIGWLSTLILSLFTSHTGSCSSYVCSSDTLKCKSWNGKCWLFGKRVKPALNLSAIGSVLVNFRLIDWAK